MPKSYSDKFIRDISEAVYKDRLNGGAERMIAQDGDAGKKLRSRAGAYDQLTRSYLKALSINEDVHIVRMNAKTVKA